MSLPEKESKETSPWPAGETLCNVIAYNVKAIIINVVLKKIIKRIVKINISFIKKNKKKDKKRKQQKT